MGWTHSWKRATSLPAESFAKASDDCRKIMTEIGVSVAGFNGQGAPVFRRDSIVFNGLGQEGCEPFEIHQVQLDRHGRPDWFSFCKTNKAPYDKCVRAALVILKQHLGNAIEVFSDGKDGDWADVRAICQKHFGYGDDFRLSNE